MNSANGLRRFVGRPEPALPFVSGQPAPRAEVCEICAVGVPSEHPHIVNLESRGLLCACRPCYLLFTHDGAGLTHQGAARGALRAVPERYLSDPDCNLSEGDWDSLQVPVSMAYFFYNSAQERIIAQYPSPAGATESLLDLGAWQTIAARNRLAASLSPDVEALIVRRAREGNEAFLVPIDACYELVGRMRLHWTGFDGGPEARQDIAEFFERVRARSRRLPAEDEARCG